jgi:hypothetical protein
VHKDPRVLKEVKEHKVHKAKTQGLKVLLLEAGRDYDPVSETPMFQTPKDAPQP